MVSQAFIVYFFLVNSLIAAYYLLTQKHSVNDQDRALQPYSPGHALDLALPSLVGLVCFCSTLPQRMVFFGATLAFFTANALPADAFIRPKSLFRILNNKQDVVSPPSPSKMLTDMQEYLMEANAPIALHKKGMNLRVYNIFQEMANAKDCVIAVRTADPSLAKLLEDDPRGAFVARPATIDASTVTLPFIPGKTILNAIAMSDPIDLKALRSQQQALVQMLKPNTLEVGDDKAFGCRAVSINKLELKAYGFVGFDKLSAAAKISCMTLQAADSKYLYLKTHDLCFQAKASESSGSYVLFMAKPSYHMALLTFDDAKLALDALPKDCKPMFMATKHRLQVGVLTQGGRDVVSGYHLYALAPRFSRESYSAAKYAPTLYQPENLAPLAQYELDIVAALNKKIGAEVCRASVEVNGVQFKHDDRKLWLFVPKPAEERLNVNLLTSLVDVDEYAHIMVNLELGKKYFLKHNILLKGGVDVFKQYLARSEFTHTPSKLEHMRSLVGDLTFLATIYYHYEEAMHALSSLSDSPYGKKHVFLDDKTDFCTIMVDLIKAERDVSVTPSPAALNIARVRLLYGHYILATRAAIVKYLADAGKYSARFYEALEPLAASDAIDTPVIAKHLTKHCNTLFSEAALDKHLHQSDLANLIAMHPSLKPLLAETVHVLMVWQAAETMKPNVQIGFKMLITALTCDYFMVPAPDADNRYLKTSDFYADCFSGATESLNSLEASFFNPSRTNRWRWQAAAALRDGGLPRSEEARVSSSDGGYM